MNNSPVILVIGAGAIGGIVAGLLKRKSYDVTLVTKHPDIAKKISSKGLEIIGNSGNFNVILPSVAQVTEITKRPDIVLITTKAPDMSAAANAILPLLGDETLVVSMQNGIVEEDLASIVGKERTVGCVVGWGATMHSNTKFEMTSSGEFVIGYPYKQIDDKLKSLANILGNIFPVEISESIFLNLYSKLIINSCITTVGAISGLTVGAMLIKLKYRILYLEIIEEAIEVAKAMKWKIPPYAGKLDYYKLIGWSTFKKRLFLLGFGFKYRKLKSSSLQSLERGKKTEVRYFNGFIVNKGKDFGVATPVNTKLLKLLEEIEEGTRKISERNIELM